MTSYMINYMDLLYHQVGPPILQPHNHTFCKFYSMHDAPTLLHYCTWIPSSLHLDPISFSPSFRFSKYVSRSSGSLQIFCNTEKVIFFFNTSLDGAAFCLYFLTTMTMLEQHHHLANLPSSHLTQFCMQPYHADSYHQFKGNNPSFAG